MLIGIDNIHAHTGKQLSHKAPLVFRTPLDLTMLCKVCATNDREVHVCRADVRTEIFTENPIVSKKFPSASIMDFDVFDTQSADDDQAPSKDDRVFLDLMAKGVKLDKSVKLMFPLPLVRDSDLPDNRDTVFRRTSGTLRSLSKSGKLSDVLQIMQKDIDEGHVTEAVNDNHDPDNDFFIPPFVVHHKKKLSPGIVYDAAAKTIGVSLNDLLL